jgi:putative spermidine/putrescine transport system substrate-binding protein
MAPSARGGRPDGFGVQPWTRRDFLRRAGQTGIFLAAGGGSLLSACGPADDTTTAPTAGNTGGTGGTDELVINSFGGAWNEALQLGFIDDFQRETGIKVTLLSTWDIAKSRAAVESGNRPPEDLLDNALPFAAPLHRDGLLAEITYDDFDQTTLELIPEGAKAPYAIDYGGFAFALAWDTEVFPEDGEQPVNWASMWDTERFPGKRGMMNWSIEPQPEFPLLADGVAPDELYPLDIDRALRKMDELRDDIPTFPDSTSAYVQSLVDRQVVMQPGYTHRLRALVDAGVDRIGISYEQARVSTQAFTVWENAPNRANAMKFLDFIIRPDVQGKWAQAGKTIPVNPEGFEHITPEVRETLKAVESGTAWTVNWPWYAELRDDGQSNFEYVIDRWSEWLEQA